jgi:ABC-type sugar transport system substrate-binding protein
MAISVSNRRIEVQFVDDDRQVTLAAASSQGSKNVEAGRQTGRAAAAAALAKGIGMVVVDRGGHKFHGRVKAVVDAAVAAGLKTTLKPVVPDEAESKAEQKPEKAPQKKASAKPSKKEEK